MTDQQTTVKKWVIVDGAACDPSSCLKECVKNCSVARMGNPCITFDVESLKAHVDGDLCIKCEICLKKCPRGAMLMLHNDF